MGFFKALFLNFSATTNSSNFTLEMPKAAKDGFRCAKLETPIPKSIAVRFDDDDKDYDSDDDLPESAHIYLANYKTKIELDHAMYNPYELKSNPGFLYPSLLSQFDTLDGDSYEEEGPSAKRPDL